MHNPHQPLKPSANKYLQQQWDQTDYEEHRRKVRNAKPTVDTKGIQIPTHVQLKLKKVQAQKERQAIIDRDNRLLATKLAEIQLSKGRIDNWNLYPVHSLNAERRREELLRVALQNQTIYQRITAQESDYKRKLLEDDWQRAVQRRDCMPHYARGVPLKEKLKKSVTFFGEPEQKQNSFSTTTEDTESTDEDIN